MDFLEHPNTFQKFTHELLLLTKDNNYLETLIKLCLEWILNDKVVLIVILKKRNVFSLLSKYKAKASPEQWKNLVIMHFEDISEISKTFIELHDWTYLPHFILLDLHEFITVGENILQKLAYTLANFRGFIQSLAIRRKRILVPDSSTSIPSFCHSKIEKFACLLTLNLDNSNISKKLFVIKNLFYYKSPQIYYEYCSLREHLWIENFLPRPNHAIDFNE